MSSSSSSPSNGLDTLDNALATTSVVKTANNTLRLPLPWKSKIFFARDPSCETRFRNFEKFVRYASSNIQAALSDSLIWISKISKGLRVSSGDAHMSDAGQSVRGKIFKVNTGRDCVFQNSYLNPFSAEEMLNIPAHSFKAPTFILTTFVSLKNLHTNIVLPRAIYFQFFSWTLFHSRPSVSFSSFLWSCRSTRLIYHSKYFWVHEREPHRCINETGNLAGEYTLKTRGKHARSALIQWSFHQMFTSNGSWNQAFLRCYSPNPVFRIF